MWKHTNAEEKMLNEINRLKAENEKLVGVLSSVVNQSCSLIFLEENEKAELDSMALSSYAEGLRTLAEYGKIEIVKEYGRRVLANWKRG